MMTEATSRSMLYFSYNGFVVFDKDVELPGCDWSDDHVAQGFARRESTVCFGTLLEFGLAEVSVTLDGYAPRGDYERVIAVPFLVTSGTVVIEGPEEMDTGRHVVVPPGNYR